MLETAGGPAGSTGEIYVRPGSPGRIFVVVDPTGHGTSGDRGDVPGLHGLGLDGAQG
ncbi:hypothetical protein [Streptomyces sp. NPDC057545]|uniref:hypothetical protein n=1 Tax=Streptomyces sp. NPDC057545 TaxID=3346164 RepID=UPI00369E11DB